MHSTAIKPRAHDALTALRTAVSAQCRDALAPLCINRRVGLAPIVAACNASVVAIDTARLDAMRMAPADDARLRCLADAVAYLGFACTRTMERGDAAWTAILPDLRRAFAAAGVSTEGTPCEGRR